MALNIHSDVTLFRENLKSDRLYVDPDGNTLHSPDCEGAIYHESLDEALEDTGLAIIEHVGKVDLDHADDPDFDRYDDDE